MNPRPLLSRRRLLGGGVAVLAVAGLTACGADDSPTDVPAAGAPEAPDGPWTWTDDLGQEIELEKSPVRIAAYGDAAAALMNFGITPVALFHYIPPSEDATFESLDLSDVEIVGEVIGEINLEQLAAAAPDLIITTSYEGEKPELMYGFKDESQMEKVRAIAPVIGVMQSGSALDVIKTNEKLVVALGIDIESGTVADQRTAFEAASAELTEAARSGLSLVPLYAEEAAGIYYAKAPDDPALAFYQSLGVQFTEVGGKDYYWHQVSWENADAYTSDIVLYSLRGSLTPEQLQDQPTFATLPAAKAEQLHPWKFKSMDYPSQTSYMKELAGWLTTDTKVT
ncbi:ABC transporter substrate-binding protein [Nocardioides sp. InS609-2]|uniref:ABC transporter substrate-binding protein n=1 Tax=Nocardioides sp. InS609-2 TaxID=2760705 RepID=UPI0020BF901C|nr:ABC transporter substrate-binding protein [Nocardioides sp. InS609-2]